MVFLILALVFFVIPGTVWTIKNGLWMFGQKNYVWLNKSLKWICLICILLAMLFVVIGILSISGIL